MKRTKGAGIAAAGVAAAIAVSGFTGQTAFADEATPTPSTNPSTTQDQTGTDSTTQTVAQDQTIQEAEQTYSDAKDAAEQAADAADQAQADKDAADKALEDATAASSQADADAKDKADAASQAAKDEQAAKDATDAAAQNATDKAKALADAKQAQAEALADLAMARDHANRLLAIIFGKGTSYDLSTNPTIKMGANGDLSYFENIFLDGKKLSLSEYKAQRGSTYVLLSDATAQALAIGTHSLTFEYEYGSVTGSFSVTRPTPTPEHNDSTGKKNATTKKDVTTKKDATPAARHAAATVEEAVALPQTGDDLPSAPLAGLLAMLGLGAIGTSRHRAKHMAD